MVFRSVLGVSGSARHPSCCSRDSAATGCEFGLRTAELTYSLPIRGLEVANIVVDMIQDHRARRAGGVGGARRYDVRYTEVRQGPRCGLLKVFDSCAIADDINCSLV